MRRLNLPLDDDLWRGIEGHASATGQGMAGAARALLTDASARAAANRRRALARAYAADAEDEETAELREPRVANASMVMTYDGSRVVARAGRVDEAAMRDLERALAIHLGLIPP